VAIDVSLLPYDARFIAFLREAQSNGRDFWADSTGGCNSSLEWS
jgi:hypothetical protein